MSTKKRSYPSDNEERYIVRMPDGMRGRIKELAEQGRRSLNSQYVLMLQAFLDDLKREEYENSDAYWDNMIEDVEKNVPSKPSKKVLLNDDYQPLSQGVREAVARLVEYVSLLQQRVDTLEVKAFSFRTFLHNASPAMSDDSWSVQRLEQTNATLQTVDAALSQAKDLLLRLLPFNPDQFRFSCAESKAGDGVDRQRMNEQTEFFSKFREEHLTINGLLVEFQAFQQTMYEVLTTKTVHGANS